MLESLAPDLWQASTSIRMPGALILPLSMTVLRLPTGGLLLCSPIAIDDALGRELDALGPVTDIVAPSVLHHRWVGAASQRFPNARVHAAPGLAGKRPDLRIDAPIDDDSAWSGAIEAVHIAGAPKLSEVALFHKPSRTLVVADLVFHITKPQGLGAAVFLRLMGVHGALRSSRAWRFATTDRAAARTSVNRLLAWDIERIAFAHGEPVTVDAKPQLESALTWLRR